MCAKVDQFLPSRSHFDSKRPLFFSRIATFPSSTFGPLFAFHCPLFCPKNNNLEWKSSSFATRDVFDLNAGVLPQMSPPTAVATLTARWRYSTRCRAVVMSKSRPDVSKMTHGFFITINHFSAKSRSTGTALYDA